jgi:4-methylaminobutanoate oxidase (formaldehyde-forming)
MRSVAKIEQFAEDTGEALAFHQSGSLKLARTPEFAAQIDDEVKRGQALGLDIQSVSPADAHRLAPYLHAEAAVRLWYTASDLYLEPGDLPRAYARAAAGLGAEVLPHTPAIAIGPARRRRARRDGAGRHRDAVVGRRRAHGAARCRNGHPRPHRAHPSSAVHYAAHPRSHRGSPSFALDSQRATGARGLMLRLRTDPLQVDVRNLPADFQIQDLALDFEPLRKLTNAVRAEFPVLAGVEIDEFRGGLPTMTVDGRHIVDQVPGVSGFFVASGCCVGGLSISPAVGEVLADWVVDGAPPLDLTSLSVTRFGPEVDSEDACARRASGATPTTMPTRNPAAASA